ncbi:MULTISPECIES: tRNA lysidine(34) synthetase TilS [Exiguobacterium]|uniref:tRNA lysidine(34) synthetase TilS n=1 Tax=Exiguobacterium TaxID=33986 RepID=UPI00047CA73A|nr:MULTISPECIES: tRNA lysidine(34) synthetase TilS [Exiguobacterium]MCT4781297.1 tRNA lysidine(34) synthetase TilS [Exiguobacterium soli]
MRLDVNLPKEPLLVAVSGGCDSMVLAHVLHEADYDILIVHVHHGLRKESDQEAEAIRNFAAARQIEFRMTRLDWEGETPSQAACRNRRYTFFRQVMAETGRHHLVLAHHRDDQLETLLIQLIRGEAHIDGIPLLRPFANGQMHRPLLAYTKQQLYDYAKEQRIQWSEDATNAETKYLRNQMRHQVLPLLAELRPGYEEATARAAMVRDEQQQEHLTYVAELVKSQMTERGLPLEVVQRLPSDFKRFVLRVLLPGSELSSNDYNRFLTWLRVDMPSGEVYYGNWRIQRTYGFLTCDRCPVRNFASEPLEIGPDLGTYHYGDHRIRFFRASAGIPVGAIRFPLTIRRPLPGDRIQLAIGTKKVSRILIDAKVPRALRTEIPVVVDATGQVLAVIGHRIAIFGSFELLAQSCLMIEW